MDQANYYIANNQWPFPTNPYLYSWGLGGFGALGIGNTTNYSSPKQVGSLTTWSIIAPAGSSTIAIKTDGTLWAWGFNQTYGQLGLGNTTNYSSPKQVGALTNWLSVVSGNYHTVAIKTNNTLWSWGNNNFGQLGLGNTTYYSSPKQVGALTNWSKISAGFYNVGAIKTDGTLWVWGYGGTGTNGQNNTTNYSSPKQIGALTTWSLISITNSNFVTAIKTDGTIWSWGQNAAGNLGLGNTTDYSSPKQIGALTNWSKTNNLQFNGVAIKTDGTLWIWGSNQYGQLGIGTSGAAAYKSSPVQVGSDTTWSVLGGDRNSAAVVKTNGSLWSWGQNGAGELGLGDTANRSSPVQVGSLTTWQFAKGGANFLIGIAST
jgi:alpha-tubulin suppressor-like RCC1 family protein